MEQKKIKKHTLILKKYKNLLDIKLKICYNIKKQKNGEL